jgi:hypothetical protein
MSEPSSNEKRASDELRLLYSSSVSEMASFKQQQWHVTNYAILLFAAIAGIPRLLDQLNQVEYLVLFGAAFAVLCAGWYVLGMLADSIIIRRRRQTEIRKTFTPEFMHAWRHGMSAVEAPDDPKEKPNLIYFFRAVLLVSFFATCWLLVRHACGI